MCFQPMCFQVISGWTLKASKAAVLLAAVYELFRVQGVTLTHLVGFSLSDVQVLSSLNPRKGVQQVLHRSKFLENSSKVVTNCDTIEMSSLRQIFSRYDMKKKERENFQLN